MGGTEFHKFSKSGDYHVSFYSLVA